MFKKGDKVFFDNAGTMYEGILVSNVYRVFTEKEIYADIYIPAIKEQITVNIKHIKKIDVMQVVKGIAYKFNIDLDANIEKHNKKLLSRGHKFI